PLVLHEHRGQTEQAERGVERQTQGDTDRRPQARARAARHRRSDDGHEIGARQQKGRYENRKDREKRAHRAHDRYSAACLKLFDGFQRSTGLRAARVSSRRRRGAKRGAALNASAAVPVLARSASARSVVMNRSRSSLAWLSVGSISIAPCTTSGKYMVIGW